MILPKVLKLDDKDMYRLSLLQSKYPQAFSRHDNNKSTRIRTFTPDTLKITEESKDIEKVTPPRSSRNSKSEQTQQQMKRCNSFKNTLEFMQQAEERIKTPVPSQLFTPQPNSQNHQITYSLHETEEPPPKIPRRPQKSFNGDPIAAMSIKPSQRSKSKPHKSMTRDMTPTSTNKNFVYNTQSNQINSNEVYDEIQQQNTEEIHSISTYSKYGSLITNQSPRQEQSFTGVVRQGKNYKNPKQPKVITVALGGKNRKV